MYVNDVNDFHLLCLRDERTDGQVYNLGSGTNNSVNEIFEIISDQLGIHVEPNRLPDMPGEALATLADISKARGLGWEPRTKLADGLRRSIDYIKQEVLAVSD